MFLGIIAWPFVFVSALVARRQGRDEDARTLRIAGWFGVAAWAVLALSFYAMFSLKMR
jgi:hypothetical protein